MKRRDFATDTDGGVHPAILKALIEAQESERSPAAAARMIERARCLFQEQFGADSEVYFVATGAGAQVLGLQTLLKSYQAVLCDQSSDLYRSACGAFENYTGSRLLSIKTGLGKITLDHIRSFLALREDERQVQPKVISLSQATPLGTVYTIEELTLLTDFAHAHSLRVHMDGERLCFAAAYAGCSLEATTRACGIDVLSFGGTNNGMLFGDAIVFIDRDLAADFTHIRTQGMQRLSQELYVAAQFNAFFSHDFWLKNALHANDMAHLLARELAPIEEIDVAYPQQTNAVFARLDRKYSDALSKQYEFSTWDEPTNEVRWSTSYATQPEDVRQFIAAIKRILKA